MNPWCSALIRTLPHAPRANAGSTWVRKEEIAAARKSVEAA